MGSGGGRSIEPNTVNAYIVCRLLFPRLREACDWLKDPPHPAQLELGRQAYLHGQSFPTSTLS